MKRISRRNFLKVAGVSAAALGLAACGGSKSGSTATSGSTAGSTAGGVNTAGFTVQYGSNPETLDPALNSAIDGANTIITIFEPLLLINENNEVVGGQAESWETSEDGLTWTFTMRDGLKWSDGTDLNAKDFEYSFKRMVDPNTAAPYAETCLGMIDGFEEAAGFPDADGNPTAEPNPDALNVKASDDGKTLTIVLSYPCSYFDKMAAFATMSPVQQATVEANGDAWCTSPDTFVSNGPYMITDWTPSERIVLTKNPNYVGGWDSSKIVSDSITLLLLGDKVKGVINLFDEGTEIMFKITDIVMSFSPYGILALMSELVHTLDLSTLAQVGVFILTDYAGLLIILLIVYPIQLKLMSKIPVIPFFKAVSPVMLVAASTTSSAACLPVSLKLADESFHVPEKIYGFGLTAGSSINSNGMAVAIGVISVFACNLYGMPLTAGIVTQFIITGLLLSMGTAGVKGAGVVLSTVMLQSLGLPLTLVPVLAAIWPIIDIGHTTMNVVGDMVGVCIIADRSGEMDTERFKKEFGK